MAIPTEIDVIMYLWRTIHLHCSHQKLDLRVVSITTKGRVLVLTLVGMNTTNVNGIGRENVNTNGTANANVNVIVVTSDVTGRWVPPTFYPLKWYTDPVS